MKSRLFYKIFASYLVVMVLSLGVMGILAAREIKQEQTARIEADLLSQARVMALMPRAEVEKRVVPLAESSGARVTFIDGAGRVSADSEADPRKMENHLNRTEIQEARIKGEGRAIHYSHTLGVNMLYVSLPIREGKTISSYIRLARPLYSVDAAINQLIRYLYHAAFVVFIPVFLIALIFSMRLMQPIREMASFTKDVRKGKRPGTLLIGTRDEIGQLARNINYMVLELQEKIHQLDEEKGKLEAAFASMIEGILILDERNRIETVNKGMRDIIGERYGDITGKTLLEAFRNVELQDAWERFQRYGKPVLQEIRLGEDVSMILDVNISVVQSVTEKKTILAFHDVTLLKQLESVRADFVANVTHEIRTPLTAIIGFAETLCEGVADVGPEANKFLRIIAENARRLDRLVDDLLMLSRIELGEVALRSESFHLFPVVEGVLELMGPKTAEKALAVNLEISGELPMLYGDRDRVSQVVLNIVDNSVKFTPAGGKIVIRAVAEGGYIVLKIKDNGIGIPKADLSRLGERFYRVDKTRSRELGGTGLGLSIVRHLMMAMKGRMEIESRQGSGTTVTLHFPIGKSSFA